MHRLQPMIGILLRRSLPPLLGLLLMFNLAAAPAAAPTPAVPPGCDPEPQAVALIADAINTALTQDQSHGHDYVWLISAVCHQEDWAFAYVKGYFAKTLAPLPTPSEVALAHRLNGVWTARLPGQADAYNQWLDQAPEALLPGSIRGLLRQISPAILQSQASLTGYNLPWPGGKTAYSIKHYYAAVDFSVNAASGVKTIRASKAGTVVFAKDSSSRLCGDPPPDFTCWQWANAVVIQSGPAEYAWYLHLQANSIPDWIQEGVYVPAGTDLGLEGSTGWASAAHVHFMVSSTYSCCLGEGDSRIPDWSYLTYRVNFNEYNWPDIPWLATSQNGGDIGLIDPPAPLPPPTATPTPLPPPPSGSPDPAPQPSSSSLCPSPYTVSAGEWLILIARKCGTTVDAIVAANPGLNPDYLRIGQQLSIPGGAAPPPPAPVAVAPAPTPVPETPPVADIAPCAGTRAVLAGENLFRIAYNCGFSTEQMAAVNGIRYPYTIYPGQILRYP